MFHGSVRKSLWAGTLAMAVGAAALGGRASANDRADDRGGERDCDESRYTVALFGDMPYGALGKAQYPALLDDINAHHVVFSVFDGDLKSGGDAACSDENLYFPALSNFAKLERPLVLVPGDNDWTDCWGRYGAGTGGFDSLERLDHERQLFFSTPYSLGQHPMRLHRQSDEGGAYALYKENVRWVKGSVVYLGVNVQGSNDNYPYAGVDGETRSDAEIARQRAEETAQGGGDQVAR